MRRGYCYLQAVLLFLLSVQEIYGHVSMYQISTRPWLYSLSQKYNRPIVKLGDIPDEEFKWMKDKNFDYIWFMGLWSLGDYGLNYDRTNSRLLDEYSKHLPGYTTADIIGSPYAVTEYKSIPELGSDHDILLLKKKLNSMGMKLMVDFVPNHSAVDANWTTTHMNYYVRAPKGTNPPYDPHQYLPNGIAYGNPCKNCGTWEDTAQFNFWDLEERKARIEELVHVASLSDAIRCDMAYLLLNDVIQDNWGYELESWGYSRPSQEWWSEAIPIVKSKYPNVIFLAEVYSGHEPTLQRLGFDYTYGKVLYDKLVHGDLGDIRHWIKSNTLQYLSSSAHFVSNHDEPRSANEFGSWWRANAAALVTFTLPGMRFHWMWESNGFKNRLLVQLRRQAPEAVNKESVLFYDKLWNITNTDIFNKGEWTYLDVFGADSSWRLIAYRWEYNGRKLVCVINYSDTQGEGKVILSNAEARNGNDTIPVRDLLSGETYHRSASEMRSQGLFTIINSWYAQILEY